MSVSARTEGSGRVGTPSTPRVFTARSVRARGSGSPPDRTDGRDWTMVILVVEDETLIALVLEIALRFAGHDVLGPAATPEEALRLAGRERPELALVDIILRDRGDGVALARALRDRYGTPSLFLSGQVPQAHANRDAAWGLIRKPYDPEAVV